MQDQLKDESKRREIAHEILKESLQLIAALGYGVDVKLSDGNIITIWPGITQFDPLLTRVSDPDESEFHKHIVKVALLINPNL